jgi:HEAT repeat protein
MTRTCQELIDALDSHTPAARGAAARSLEHARHIPCLTGSLDSGRTTPRQRQLICSILYRLRAASASAAVRKHLRDPHPSVRAAAAEALGGFADAAAGPALLALLANRNEPVAVRDTAALSLGMVRYAPAKPELTICLGDPAPTVRACAARALALLGERAALPALTTALSEERDDHVTTALQYAIRALESGVEVPQRAERPGSA